MSNEKWSEWTQHDGVRCPLPINTPVEVEFRDGSRRSSVQAMYWAWKHKEQDDDIIAYRYKIKEPESIEVTEAEEEAWQAKEREPNGKQLRYQDSKGEDWIDEFARTKSVDEFRGAMSFNIGKYNRRAGKKDDIPKELDKIIDYCQRWKDYELGLK